MPCEREGCGHPLAVHDPCSLCGCQAYEPADRKDRAALLTDVADGVPPPRSAARKAWLAKLAEAERVRFGGLS